MKTSYNFPRCSRVCLEAEPLCFLSYYFTCGLVINVLTNYQLNYSNDVHFNMLKYISTGTYKMCNQLKKGNEVKRIMYQHEARGSKRENLSINNLPNISMRFNCR